METVRGAVRRLYKSRIVPFNVIIISGTIITSYASSGCRSADNVGGNGDGDNSCGCS